MQQHPHVHQEQARPRTVPGHDRNASHRSRSRLITPRAAPLALAAWTLLAAMAAQAQALAPSTLPAGLQVSAGQAQVTTSASRMTVTPTPQAILNWNSFSIGSAAGVHFQQQAASSQVLNRVTGQDPSQILGSLTSNGRVWLLNPNGVIFGSGARVDVAGLVASTLRLNDGDWLAGRYSFSQGAGAAEVLNQGELRSSFGGHIALVGGSVRNEGQLQAPGGQIVLAAGDSVELVDTGAPALAVRITAPQGQALNLGSLQAAGGRIDIHAAAVNSSGIVSADGFASGPGGQIWIRASGRVDLPAGSRSSADGSAGGLVHVESDSAGSTLQGALSAQGSVGAGGAVAVLGREVGLLDSASIDASGAQGGGQVVVGGGLRGQDTRYANAQAVFMGPDTRITADATQQGDGGHVVLWSDKATRAYGSLSARAGLLGGDGGFIETSGGWLDARPKAIDTRAPKGRGGEWLIDPADITISNAPTTTVTLNNGTFTPTANNSFLDAAAVNSQLSAGDVTVTTQGTSGAGTGKITVTDTTLRSLSNSGNSSLTLDAAGGITVNNASMTVLGSGSLNLYAAGGPIAILNNSFLTASGSGAINLTGGPSGAQGIDSNGNSFSAAGGLSTSTHGVEISGGSSVVSGLGAINIGGLSAATGQSGVFITGAVGSLSTQQGPITIQGDARDGPGITVGPPGNVISANSVTLWGRGSTAGVSVASNVAQPGNAVSLLEIIGRSTSATSPGLELLNFGVLSSGGSSPAYIAGFNTGGPSGSTPGIDLKAGSTIIFQSVGGDITTADSFVPSGENRQLLRLQGTIDIRQADAIVSLNASRLSLDGATITTLFSAIPFRLDMTTANGITVNNTQITPAGSSSTVSMLADTGPIAITGGSVIALPGFNSSFSANGNASGSATGVLLSGGSTITAGSITVVGQASGSGDGLRIDSSSMTGGHIDLTGFNNSTTNNVNGVTMSGATSALRPSDGLNITGVGGFTGVDLSGGLLAFSGSAGSSITGTQSSGTGYTAVNLGTGLRMTDTASASLDIVGSVFGPPNVLDAVTMDGVNINLRSSLNVRADAGPTSVKRINIRNSSIAVNGGLNIQAGYGTSDSLTVVNSTITADGAPAELRGSYQTYAGTNTFTAIDTEFRFMQANPSPASSVSFDNAGTLTMNTSGSGRWIVFASNINSPFFQPGNLPYDYKRYGATGPASWASDTGNGFASASNASALFPGNALDRPYDGSTVIAFDNGGTLTGGIAGDKAVGSIANKNVGNAKPTTVGIVDANNKPVFYSSLAATGGLSVNIASRDLPVFGMTAASKVYDATSLATLTGGTVTPLLGDAVSLSGFAAGSFANKNVGNARPVTISGLSLTGADAGNYTLQLPTLSANITPRPVAVTGLSVNSKVYDGSTAATATGSPAVARLGSDVLALGGTAIVSFADKNVGNGKALTLSGLTLTGSDAGNYTLQPLSQTASITPRTLPIGGLIANDKVYDATPAASLGGSATLAPLGSDNVVLGGSAFGSFADKNVGTGKAVTVGGLTLSGGDSGNYTLQLPALQAAITPRPVTLAGLSVASKVYDATVTATLVGTAASPALGNDQLGLVGTPTAVYADKNVGNGKAVTVTGIGLTGNDAGNYTLQPSPLSGDITPRPIALAGLRAAGKVYDGNTSAVISGTPGVAALAGDSVAVGGQAVGRFVDKNAGLGKAVSASGISLLGGDAGNYQLQPATLTADITPLALSLAGLSVSTKVYDGGTSATLGSLPPLSVISGDTVTLVGTGAASFADRNVGIGKPVTVSGLGLGGSDAANYTLRPAQLTGSITPLGLVPQGLSVATKVYDASTTAALQGTASVRALGTDQVALAGNALAAFADSKAGSGKPVAVSGLSLTGSDAGNYSLQSAPLVGSITPRPLAVAGVIASSKVYDGSTAVVLDGTATVSPLAQDSVTVIGKLEGRFADKAVGTAKPVVNVDGLALSGASAANYTLQLPTLSADITPRPVGLSGLSVGAKVYDATVAATLGGTAVVTPLPGDNLALSGTPAAAFADKNVGTGKAVNVAGLRLVGSDAGNYTLQPGVLAGTITPRALALQGLAVADKTYDGSAAATLVGSPQLNVLAGDAAALAGNGAARYADGHVGNAKAVNISGWTLGGSDAANYALTLPGLSGSIRPATLSYAAQPVQRIQGEVVGTLQGQVTGFVGSDTPAAATTGTLIFSTTATETAAVGRYPVTGSGLQARDYVFVQDPGNATAFTMLPVPVTAATPAVVAVTSAVVTSSNNASSQVSPVTTVVVSQAGISVGSGGAGLVDITSAAASTSSTTAAAAAASTAAAAAVSSATSSSGSGPASTAFAAVRLSSLSAGELTQLLAGRRAYTANLFSEASQKLTANPKLADMQACLSVDEAAKGLCLITPELKSRLAAAAPATVEAKLPSPATAPAPSLPVAAAMPAPTAAPSAEARHRTASEATGVRVARLLDQRRAVRQAALPQIERKLALIIGIGNYEDAAIPTLNNAVRDAQAVARTLEDRLGYETVVLENASKAEMVAAMNRIALTAASRDSVVIYFAGHGELVAATQQGYWLPADSNPQQPETWLSNADISRLIAQIGASQVALISDSCYSGSLALEERIRASPETLNPVAVLDRKSVVVMSSGGNQPVADEGRDGHSPFAYHLIDNLSKLSNWQAGGNIFERVRFAVAKALPQRPQYSASRAAGHQPGGDYLFEQRQLDQVVR